MRSCFLIILLIGFTGRAFAQLDPSALPQKSAKKAFGLSLLVPGLGHRYVNDSGWGRTGSLFLAAEVGFWYGLLSSRSEEDRLIQQYETHAALEAGALIDGKGRAFFLNIGLYESSEEFRDVLLRTRQWDRLAFAEDAVNQWQWSDDAQRLRYRELRDEAESAGRRTSIFIGALAANRIISGVTSILALRKKRPENGIAFRGGVGLGPGQTPVARVRISF